MEEEKATKYMFSEINAFFTSAKKVHYELISFDTEPGILSSLLRFLILCAQLLYS